MREFWSELRRRKVVRVPPVCLVGAWVLLQVGDTVLDPGDFHALAGRILLAALALGFPAALTLSLSEEMGAHGLIKAIGGCYHGGKRTGRAIV